MSLMSPPERELGLLEHAAAVAENLNDFRLLIRVRNLLGIMLGDAGRYDEAEVQLDLALALTRCDPDAFDPVRVNANTANLLRKRAQSASESGRVAEAESLVRAGLALLERARKESAHHGITPMLLDIYGIEGLLHNAVARPADALRCFSEAWRLGQSSKLRTNLPFLGVEIARLELASGRLDSAELTLLQAMREATFYRPSPKAAALCKLLADVQKARGDQRGEQHWQRAADEAELAFDELKHEVRRQLAALNASWQEFEPIPGQVGGVA
jgi:tetratricopeptide (TPR) repeat protein